MDEQLLSTELQKFNVTDAAISELSSKYMVLKIDGVDDKKGAKAVHEARMDIKGRRVAVQKAGKERLERHTKQGRLFDDMPDMQTRSNEKSDHQQKLEL